MDKYWVLYSTSGTGTTVPGTVRHWGTGGTTTGYCTALVDWLYQYQVLYGTGGLVVPVLGTVLYGTGGLVVPIPGTVRYLGTGGTSTGYRYCTAVVVLVPTPIISIGRVPTQNLGTVRHW